MKSRLGTVTFAVVFAVLISILVLPGQGTIGENGANGTKLVSKPFGASRNLSSRAGRSPAGERGKDDRFSRLFVPESGSVESMMTQAGQSSDVVATTRAIQEVRPAEFNGNVRDLPQVPSVELEELKLNEPKSNKKPTVGVVPESGPNNTPLAAMPSPIQNFAGLSNREVRKSLFRVVRSDRLRAL